MSWIPTSIKNQTSATHILEKTKLHNYGLMPNFPPFSAHPTMNGEILGRIAVGAISVHPNIARVTLCFASFFPSKFVKIFFFFPPHPQLKEKTVVFDDGFEIEADVVIYSTGYEISFPFLDQKEVPVDDNKVDLYKFVFPPTHKHATLAFVGLIQPWGAIMPISEMQARWITRVFNGKSSLVSKKDMWADIKRTQEEMALRYKKSARHTIQIDYVPYMDEIAKLIGVYPSFWQIFLKDRSLLKEIFVGATVPAQYRLIGPNSSPEAPAIIRTVMQRAVFPSRTREGE